MRKSFEFKGQKIFFYSEKVQNKQWIHVNGRTICIDLSASGAKSRRQERSGHQNLVLAPMPGKVTKVMVSSGQSVQVGDSVVVMEAMKMEYTLKAEIAGTIKAIPAQVGGQVSLGQLLVEISGEQK